MSIDINEELEKNIKKTVSDKGYPDKINEYLFSIIHQLRDKGGIDDGDLKDLLEKNTQLPR